jgi:hypothetical protein
LKRLTPSSTTSSENGLTAVEVAPLGDFDGSDLGIVVDGDFDSGFDGATVASQQLKRIQNQGQQGCAIAI